MGELCSAGKFPCHSSLTLIAADLAIFSCKARTVKLFFVKMTGVQVEASSDSSARNDPGQKV